jgi:hypothetical protein
MRQTMMNDDGILNRDDGNDDNDNDDDGDGDGDDDEEEDEVFSLLASSSSSLLYSC